MSNQNQNEKTEQVKAEEQVQKAETTPVQQAEPQVVMQVQMQQPVQQKEGIGGWLKRHWKGVVGATVGLGTAVGSAFVAYKKGKAAGINSMPMPNDQNDDYSLNPNE